MKKASGVFRAILIFSATASVLGCATAAILFWHFSKSLPKIMTVADYRPPIVTKVLSAPETPKANPDDLVIGEFYNEVIRYIVPYDKIPEVLIRAFISAEDDQFFQHTGVNFVSLLRASIANFKAGRFAQGGSTITQQVAKSLLLTSEKSIIRKIKEIFIAEKMEKHLTKQQILYLYLNQIYLGHSTYGVQAASRIYFRKDVSQITLAEAALLAGLPQAPGKYSPVHNPKKAKERQLYVLRRMFENNFITQAQFNEAAAFPVKIYRNEDVNAKFASYYVEHIRRYLLQKYGEKTVYEDGLTVFVPLKKSLAQAASKSVRDGLAAVDKRDGYRGPLKRLKSNAEIEEFLTQQRVEIIRTKVPYQLLLPDGRLDTLEAFQKSGIKGDLNLLSVGEAYEGVVSSVDDKRKFATVLLGVIKAELPLDKMKWARPARDEKNPTVARPEPSVPSRVLVRGDVILVKVVSASEKSVVVALDQIPQVQSALFSMDVGTGAVLAMEGGYDYSLSEFNRAIQAQLQPGSSFKPIIYTAALEKGYTPASIIVDAPLTYDDAETGKWKPANFESKFYGDTTFRQALIKSRNVPTIKIVQDIQIPYLIDYSKRLGLDSVFPRDLSISLGSSAVSLIDLTKVYALYPRLGRKIEPIFILKVVDRDGKVLEEHKLQQPQQALEQSLAFAEKVGKELKDPKEPKPASSATPAAVSEIEQLLDPRVAYVMTHLMKEVVVYGTGHEAKSLGRSVAGKTGTTNDFIDAWFMGFTPQVVTGVWVGFDSHKPIGPSETGARAALPIWLSFMKEAVKPYPETDFVVPQGVVFENIDAATGKLAPSNWPGAIKEAFIEGTQPTARAEPGGNSAPARLNEIFKED
ncbi:PBP1A family penicillin-binding protein [Bdellovibrionota bacterium FG-2]